jgi:hypothetical protein
MTTEVQTDTEQQLDFSAAFAEFSKPEAAEPVDKPVEPVAETPADGAPTEPEPVAAAPEEKIPPAVAEGEVREEPEAPTPEPERQPVKTSPDDAALVSRFADILRDGTKAPEKTPEREPAPEYVPFSKDELTLLQQYEQDFPDVAKAELIRRREEYRQLANYMNSAWEQKYNALAEQVENLAVHTQVAQLKEEVPEYSDDLVTKVEQWAAKQPTYLQKAYQDVIASGTVQEVKDLVTRFKAETGYTGQATAPTAAAAPARSPAPKKEPELPPAAKQAVAGLAPVSSKRSAPIAEPDLNDFDSAFSAFAKIKD